jgi:hypothetical protein
MRRRFLGAALTLEPDLKDRTREFVRIYPDAAPEDAVCEARRLMLETWAKYNLENEWCRLWVPGTLIAIG